MQRLILGSDRIDCLPSLLDRAPADTPVVYVPTAGDLADDRTHVQLDLDRLTGHGFPVTELSLAEASPADVADRLAAARLVFVAGGNGFHLLDCALRSGFAKAVTPLVREGRVLYLGLSVGGILAGPDMNPTTNQAARAAVPDLASTEALGLVPFSTLPHYGNPARRERHEEILGQDHAQEIAPVSDEQLVLVHGDNRQVVSAIDPEVPSWWRS
ncbi:MAG: type 1 glutamine amidotransferase-like domain-containing protein [Catenulispora sp.]|nr:type 1 glutamine amidotransferase-like domain-containing protein [Catenulispora sp.]